MDTYIQYITGNTHFISHYIYHLKQSGTATAENWNIILPQKFVVPSFFFRIEMRVYLSMIHLQQRRAQNVYISQINLLMIVILMQIFH